MCALVLTAPALLGSACTNAEAARAPVHAVIRVSNLAFTPGVISVPPGSTVTWQFADSGVPHDVVAREFRTPLRASGEFRRKFENPGPVRYSCSAHPGMMALIYVE